MTCSDKETKVAQNTQRVDGIEMVSIHTLAPGGWRALQICSVFGSELLTIPAI